MDTPNWAALLAEAFPNLASEGFEVVGQPSEQCNRIAYAAGELHHAAFSYQDHVIIFRERGVEMPSNLGFKATGWLEGQCKYALMVELQALISTIT